MLQLYDVLRFHSTVVCCDRKSRAAYEQSFALWQQATIEIMRRNLSYYCLLALHIYMVLFFTHIPFVVNQTINATPPERLQQHPLLFTTNRTDRTFFVWRLNSTFTSWSQHHFVAIGNPERHVRRASHRGSKQQQRSPDEITLLLLVRATYIMVLFFTHISFVVNHTINATPPERLQQHPVLYQRSAPIARSLCEGWTCLLCLLARHICMVLFFTHIPFVWITQSTQHHRRGCNKLLICWSIYHPQS